MNFASPALLFGALFSLVPLAIHLLNRARYREEPFGGMMFLKRAVELRATSVRIKDIILLCMRMLFFGLLAAALARPIAHSTAMLEEEQPTTHVLILDGSYSMADGEAFSEAKANARKIINKMNPSDNMFVVLAGEKPDPLVAVPSFDKSFLMRKIEALTPGQTSTDLPRAIEQALWMLEESTLPRHRIYILTDEQIHGWQIENAPLWEQIRNHRELLKVNPSLYVLANKGREFVNLAVANVSTDAPVVDRFRRTTFHVELANHAKMPVETKVIFKVDGVKKAERNINLIPGSTKFTFDHLFQESGSHHVSVELPEDDLPFDNNWVYSVHVMRKLHILIVDDSITDDTLESDSGLLRFALESAGDDSLFTVTTKTSDELSNSNAKLTDYHVVAITNVKSLSDQLHFALEQYVDRGGGLFLSLGPDVDPEAYNQMRRNREGLIPADIQQRQAYSTNYFYPVFGGSNKGTFFTSKEKQVLSDVRITEFWQCKPDAGADILATFGDYPFLILKNYGYGKSLLWATTVNTEWTNFPATQDYLPLLQQIMLHLCAKVSPPANLSQGEELVYSTHRPVFTPPENGELPEFATLTTPENKKEVLKLQIEEEERTARWADTKQPGLYTIEAPGLPARFFAVQLDREEGNPDRLTLTDKRRLAGEFDMKFTNRLPELFEELEKESGAVQWWQEVIVLAVLLLLFELGVSWKFSRQS